jgi:hypothetical protein
MSSRSVRGFASTAKVFLRFIGYATFSVNRDEKVFVSVFDAICLLSNLFAAAFVLFLAFNYGFRRLVSSSSVLLFLGSTITMVGSSLVSITSMILVFCHRFRIWKLIVLLDSVIDEFKKIHVQPMFTRKIIFFITMAAITFSLVIVGLLIMYFGLGYSEKLGILVVFGYLSMSFSASMGWSTMFYTAIYMRLNLINEAIR